MKSTLNKAKTYPCLMWDEDHIIVALCFSDTQILILRDSKSESRVGICSNLVRNNLFYNQRCKVELSAVNHKLYKDSRGNVILMYTEIKENNDLESKAIVVYSMSSSNLLFSQYDPFSMNLQTCLDTVILSNE